MSREGRGVGPRRASGRHRVRQVPSPARFSGAIVEARAVRRLPCRGERARREESRPCRLHVVSRRQYASAVSGARVQQLPRPGSFDRPQGSPEMRLLPRAPPRRATRASLDLHHLSPEQDPGPSWQSREGLRDLSSGTRSQGTRRCSHLHELPSAEPVAGAPRGIRACGVHAMPHVARGASLRSRNVHEQLPREPPRSPSAGDDLHGLPRLSGLAVLPQSWPRQYC
jgi:hypothetical protein